MLFTSAATSTGRNAHGSPAPSGTPMKIILSISAAALVLWGLATLAGIANREGNTATNDSGVYRIAVTQIGFMPAEITIPKGRPVTLMVTRFSDETSIK